MKVFQALLSLVLVLILFVIPLDLPDLIPHLQNVYAQEEGGGWSGMVQESMHNALQSAGALLGAASGPAGPAMEVAQEVTGGGITNPGQLFQDIINNRTPGTFLGNLYGPSQQQNPPNSLYGQDYQQTVQNYLNQQAPQGYGQQPGTGSQAGYTGGAASQFGQQGQQAGRGTGQPGAGSSQFGQQPQTGGGAKQQAQGAGQTPYGGGTAANPCGASQYGQAGQQSGQYGQVGTGQQAGQQAGAGGASSGGDWDPNFYLPPGGKFGQQKWMPGNDIDIFINRGSPIKAPADGSINAGQAIGGPIGTIGSVVFTDTQGRVARFVHVQPQGAPRQVKKGEVIATVYDQSMDMLGPYPEMPDGFQHIDFAIATSIGALSYRDPGAGGDINGAQYLVSHGYGQQIQGQTRGPNGGGGGGLPGMMPGMGGMMPGMGGFGGGFPGMMGPMMFNILVPTTYAQFGGQSMGGQSMNPMSMLGGMQQGAGSGMIGSGMMGPGGGGFGGQSGGGGLNSLLSGGGGSQASMLSGPMQGALSGAGGQAAGMLSGGSSSPCSVTGGSPGSGGGLSPSTQQAQQQLGSSGGFYNNPQQAGQQTGQSSGGATGNGTNSGGQIYSVNGAGQAPNVVTNQPGQQTATSSGAPPPCPPTDANSVMFNGARLLSPTCSKNIKQDCDTGPSHQGNRAVDFAASPGQQVFAPFTSAYTKQTDALGNTFCLFTSPAGTFTIYSIDPTNCNGSFVNQGQVIGTFSANSNFESSASATTSIHFEALPHGLIASNPFCSK
jgi:hypothetical protein